MAAQDKDPATLRGKVTAAWEDLEKRVEAGVQKAASRALAPLIQQVTELRSRVEKLANRLEDVARTRLGMPGRDATSGKDKDTRS